MPRVAHGVGVGETSSALGVLDARVVPAVSGDLGWAEMDDVVDVVIEMHAELYVIHTRLPCYDCLSW